jgi:hypothetical protein
MHALPGVEPGIPNPYESGSTASPSAEGDEKLHWASASSITFAVIAFFGFVFLIGYALFSARVPPGVRFQPDPFLTPAGFICWGAGSLLGTIAGAVGLARGRSGRPLALSALLVNVLLALAMLGLIAIGWSASHR